MTQLPIAISLLGIAFLAWDGWRRKMAIEAARTTDVEDRVHELDEKVVELAKSVETQAQALKNGVAEMRGMLTPLRAQVLAAQQKRD